MNFSLIAQQQNYLLLGALVFLAGLMCIIFGKKNNTNEQVRDVKCPFCAEYIKPDAIKCKHCQSELPRNFANPAAMQLLEEFKNYSHRELLGHDGSIIESNVQKFANVGVKYLESIEQANGDLPEAENELLTKIHSIAENFENDRSEEFNSLYVKYSPWLVLK